MKSVWEALRPGPESGILVCDFDGTMTEAGSSMHAVSRILGPESEFTRAREELYQKYKWVLSSEGGKNQCKAAAEEWWTGQMELYVRFGIEKEYLMEAARTLTPREECVELLHRCAENSIPVWIVSAGIANVIEYWLDGQGLESAEFHILANRIFYDGERPSGYSTIITIWNKAGIFFREAGDISGRKLIFLGNHPADVGWRTENSENFLIGNRE